MNKKGDIAITVLVVMAIVTAGAASFIFLSSSNNLEETIYNSRNLDNLYSGGDKLNFYVNEVMSAAVSRTYGEIINENGNLDRASTESKENFRTKFVPIFLEELGKYKNKDSSFVFPELLQVEEQMNKDKIIIENGKVFLTLDMVVRIEEDGLISQYSYRKTFEKEIPTQNI